MRILNSRNKSDCLDGAGFRQHVAVDERKNHWNFSRRIVLVEENNMERACLIPNCAESFGDLLLEEVCEILVRRFERFFNC